MHKVISVQHCKWNDTVWFFLIKNAKTYLFWLTFVSQNFRMSKPDTRKFLSVKAVVQFTLFIFMFICVSWQMFHFVKTYLYIISEHSSEILFTDTDMLCPGTGLRPTVKHYQNYMGSAVCVNSRWLCKSLILFQTWEKKKGKKKSTYKPKWWLFFF